MLAIIDYGVGNLFSLQCSLKKIGVEAVVTKDADIIKNADRIIVLLSAKVMTLYLTGTLSGKALTAAELNLLHSGDITPVLARQLKK